MRLPDGFRSDPEFLKQVKKDGVFAAYRLSGKDGRIIAAVCLRRFRKVIEEGPISPAQVRSYRISATVRRERWQDFTIDVVRYPESYQGRVVLDLVAHIPLEGEAVLLDIFGP